ncbi:MAG: FG-GAP repeat protein, partial [Arenicella sp.]|nr:FG-GAP repeat protein [Arenicella sp.]
LANIDDQIATVLLDGVVVSGGFELNIDSANDLATFTPESDVELRRCYQISTLDSSWTGIAANDAVLEQNLEACTFDSLIEIPDYLYVLEGTNTGVELRVSDSIVGTLSGQLSAGNVISAEPLLITDTAQYSISAAETTISIPLYPEADYADGQQLAISVNSLFAGDSALSVGNSLWLTVLQIDGDFDNDGLSNGLEFSIDGYDPANSDSDSNGIDDGFEDLDGDGLSNLDEIANNTQIDNVDSDNDGLSDFDEVYIYGSDPNSSDSDGDGISDFIEVISESDPASDTESFVDPYYVTALEVTPISINHNLGEDGDTVQLTVTATFDASGRIELVDMTGQDELIAYESDDIVLVTSSVSGELTMLAPGDTVVNVLFLENSDLNQSVAVTVNEVTLIDLPDEYSIITPYNGAVIASQATDLVIVIDYMNQEYVYTDEGEVNLLQLQVDSVRGLLDTVDFATTHVAILTSAFGMQVELGLSSDRAAIELALDDIAAVNDFFSNSNPYDYLDAALTELKGEKSRSFATPMLIGFVGADVDDEGEGEGEGEGFNFNLISDALAIPLSTQTSPEIAIDAGVVINLVSLSGSPRLDNTFVEFANHARISGGNIHHLNGNFNQLPDLLPKMFVFDQNDLTIQAASALGSNVSSIMIEAEYSEVWGELLSGGDNKLVNSSNRLFATSFDLRASIAPYTAKITVTESEYSQSLTQNTHVLPTLNQTVLTGVYYADNLSGSTIDIVGKYLVARDSTQPSTADPSVFANTVVMYDGSEITPVSLSKFGFSIVLPTDVIGETEIFAYVDGVKTNSLFLNITDVDSDGDGLTNSEEEIVGTNPNRVDTDYDGLTDKQEVDGRTDPLRFDTDNDGIGDSVDLINEWYFYFNGDAPYSNYGSAVANAGDVNNDGINDIVVSGPSNSSQILSGANGTQLYYFEGDKFNDSFGAAVSGAGDVNGDGVADFIIGAYADDNNGSQSGSARLFSGIDGATIRTYDGDSAGDYFGKSVSALGDVNNDGCLDLLVSAERDSNTASYAGSVSIVSGCSLDRIHTIYGDSAYDEFGRSIDGVGDINGDGRPDFIVGAPFDDNNGISSSGSVKLISGFDWATLHMFDGDAANDSFGSSVGNAGDVDGDGTNDIIVGFPGSDYNGDRSGGARVFSGANMEVLYTFYGESADSSFGYSVSSAGDVNNDGFD